MTWVTGVMMIRVITETAATRAAKGTGTVMGTAVTARINVRGQ
jgi:hypothetical protein